MRAKSIGHAEHAILTELVENIDIAALREQMVDDAVSAKRFDDAARNILSMLDRLLGVREKFVPEA
jgi:hypothetical protein